MAFCSSGSIFDDDKLIQIQFSLARNDTEMLWNQKMEGKGIAFSEMYQNLLFWNFLITDLSRLICNFHTVDHTRYNVGISDFM